MTDLVTRYLAAWNETDPAARRSLVDALFTEDAEYTDPMAGVAGRSAIDALIAAVQQQFAGCVFTALGHADEHHAQARFRWGLGPAGADPVVEGFDVVRLDDQGRITTVLGFLDVVPSP
jgi:hypothetical protein